VLVLDAAGHVLARRPDGDRWRGRKAADAGVARATRSERPAVVETGGVDGVARIYAFEPVGGAMDRMVVAVGRSRPVVLAAANANFVRSLIALGALTAFAFALATVAGEVLIRRPANAMAAIVGRFAAGALGARHDFPRATRELGRIAAALDGMAATFEQRALELAAADGERARAMEALAASEARYRGLFESSPVPTWLYDRTTRRLLAVNEAVVATYGYSRAELLAMTVDDLVAPDARGWPSHA
jgi:PAS domain-containing protein